MNPSKLWFLTGLALILTACPSTPAPKAAAQPMTSVSGTVVDGVFSGDLLTTKAWSGGAGHVDGVIDTDPMTAHTSTVITTGTLAANGSFTLSLPKTVPASALTPFNSDTVNLTGLFYYLTGGMGTCTGTPTFSTLNSSETSLGLVAVGTVKGEARPQQSTATTSTETTSAGTVTHRDEVNQEGAVVYFDAPVTLSGMIICSGPTIQTPAGTVRESVTFDLKFAQGWNEVTQDMSSRSVISETTSGTTSEVTLTIKLTSGTLPTNQWVVLPATPTGQSLGRHSRPFWR